EDAEAGAFEAFREQPLEIGRGGRHLLGALLRRHVERGEDEDVRRGVGGAFGGRQEDVLGAAARGKEEDERAEKGEAESGKEAHGSGRRARREWSLRRPAAVHGSGRLRCPPRGRGRRGRGGSGSTPAPSPP